MKRKLLLFLLAWLSIQLTFSQDKKEITVLYLIPFHISDSHINISEISTELDIFDVSALQMIGFWEGAKLGLSTYEYSDKKIEVIVRDITTDEVKLKQILEDDRLMKDVDLIIGPFYGSLIPIAAQYANEKKIMIVNPFSIQEAGIETNPYLYKLKPNISRKPEMVKELILDSIRNYKVHLWCDNKHDENVKLYTDYFDDQEIAYQIDEVKSHIYKLNLDLGFYKHHVIIALFNNPTVVMNQMRLFSNATEGISYSFIFPEEWLNFSVLDEDFYSLKNLYYFTNCFVEANEKSAQFIEEYVAIYQTPCQLERFSFQGYDITRYFIDLYFAQQNPNLVEFTPLSYRFKFKKWSQGGFENEIIRLIKIENFEKREISK